jgi:hypothetical protein
MTELLSNRAMWAGAGINHDQKVGGSVSDAVNHVFI